MSSLEHDEQIEFLAPESFTVAPPARREGYGEEQGALETVATWLRLKSVKVPRDKVRIELTKVRGHIDAILADVGDRASHGFRLEEVVVGITVSADGHFGIATVGAETTLELTFKRHDHSVPQASSEGQHEGLKGSART